MFGDCTFVVQFAYFDTRANKGREQQNGLFSCFFGATFEKIWLKKASFDLFEQLFEKSRATCGEPQNITIANHSINKSGPLFSEEGRMGVGQFEKYPCVAEKMRTRGTIKEEIEHVLSTIQVTF